MKQKTISKNWNRVRIQKPLKKDEEANGRVSIGVCLTDRGSAFAWSYLTLSELYELVDICIRMTEEIGANHAGN